MAKSSSSHRKKRDKISSKVLFFIHPVLGLGFSCSSSHAFCLFIRFASLFSLLEYSVWILDLIYARTKSRILGSILS